MKADRPRSEIRSEGPATFRLYEELNDFLPTPRSKAPFPVAVQPGDTVGACLRRLGVPERAVDLVLVDGASVGLEEPVVAGSRVAVYPVFESFDVTPTARLPGRPLRRLRFAVPPDLAGLADRLAAAGFDAARVAADEPESVRRAARRGLVWLTRDPEFASRSGLTRVYRVRASHPIRQLAEVLRRFQLRPGQIGRRP